MVEETRGLHGWHVRPCHVKRSGGLFCGHTATLLLQTFDRLSSLLLQLLLPELLCLFLLLLQIALGVCFSATAALGKMLLRHRGCRARLPRLLA